MRVSVHPWHSVGVACQAGIFPQAGRHLAYSGPSGSCTILQAMQNRKDCCGTDWDGYVRLGLCAALHVCSVLACRCLVTEICLWEVLLLSELPGITCGWRAQTRL